MQTIKEKTKNAFTAMKSEFGYKNAMQAPKIQKVVISSGVGSVKDKKKIELIADRLSKIILISLFIEWLQSNKFIDTISFSLY